VETSVTLRSGDGSRYGVGDGWLVRVAGVPSGQDGWMNSVMPG